MDLVRSNGAGTDVARAAREVLGWARVANDAAVPDLVSALGRLGEPSLAEEIAPLAEHASPEVRVVVAQVLGELCSDAPATVAALILLSQDPVEEVRSWATFSLAAENVVRLCGVDDALVACLIDESVDVRVEAARGLARLAPQ